MIDIIELISDDIAATRNISTHPVAIAEEQMRVLIAWQYQLMAAINIVNNSIILKPKF